jgi:hypothetical protein
MSAAVDLAKRLAELQRLHRATEAEMSRVARKLAAERGRKKRSRYDIPECGTESGYQRHRHRGEECALCRRAHADHNRLQYRIAEARRRAESREAVA